MVQHKFIQTSIHYNKNGLQISEGVFLVFIGKNYQYSFLHSWQIVVENYDANS
jgi:hypothetical protein